MIAALLKHNRSALNSADDLNNISIMVIGLWSMGVKDFSRIAKMSGCFGEEGEERLENVMIALQDSSHPVVVSIMRDGLPPGLYAPVGWNGSVFCRSCRCFVKMIPCPACSMPVVNVEFGELPVEEVPPMLPPHGTLAMPGTLSKIEIMRHRFERGLSVFHPDDPVI